MLIITGHSKLNIHARIVTAVAFILLVDGLMKKGNIELAITDSLTKIVYLNVIITFCMYFRGDSS